MTFAIGRGSHERRRPSATPARGGLDSFACAPIDDFASASLGALVATATPLSALAALAATRGVRASRGE